MLIPHRWYMGVSPCQIASRDTTRPDNINIEPSLNNIEGSNPVDDVTQMENVYLVLFSHRNITGARKFTYRDQNKIRGALLYTKRGTENESPFMKGDLVYRFREKKKKHEPLWDDSYRIYEQTVKNTNKLVTLDNRIGKVTYHSSKLKSAYSYYGSPIRTALEYTRVYS